MRLDKLLSELKIGSRSRVKEEIRRGSVTVNGQTEDDPGRKVDENSDVICFHGERVSYQRFYYYMLNKPSGVVSATSDLRDRTVLDLLSAGDRRDDLFPVGRLDKDTEGLLLLTNDGELAHRLLAPKRHVDKSYYVRIAHELSGEEVSLLENGVDIGEEKLTLPGKVERISESEILLTIHEGKFHQVKRMLSAVGNEVMFLKRLSFGGLKLDEKLAPGAYRELTEAEVKVLHEA
ncbi:MAG: pseudouridine synthase [Acetatifactor sp.]